MADYYDFGYGDPIPGSEFIDQEVDLPPARDTYVLPVDEPTIDPQPGDGTPGSGWGNPGDWGTILTQLEQGDFANLIKGILSGQTGGKAGQTAAFMGLAALLNKATQQKPDPVGYQYGIPRYTAARQQTPVAQQRPTTTTPEGRTVPYRPGQGGITYFTPMQYSYAGYEPRKAEEFLQRPAGAPDAPAAPPAPSAPTDKYAAPPPQIGSYNQPRMSMDIQPGDRAYELMKANSSVGMASGGIAMLAKGRHIRGAGDGVSDSVTAKFADSGRPALLSDGEFVIPARIVAEVGNGSNDAGAEKFYAFLDRVEARAKAAKRGKPSGADKELNKLA